LLVDLPLGVEVTMRENGDRRLLFIQNCLDGKTELKEVPAGRNLLDNDVPVTGNLSLDAYGCAIVELD
jgi:beta-galactosidase